MHVLLFSWFYTSHKKIQQMTSSNLFDDVMIAWRHHSNKSVHALVRQKWKNCSADAEKNEREKLQDHGSHFIQFHVHYKFGDDVAHSWMTSSRSVTSRVSAAEIISTGATDAKHGKQISFGWNRLESFFEKYTVNLAYVISNWTDKFIRVTQRSDLWAVK